MKLFLTFLFSLALVACASVPQGEYDVYPASGQVITPEVYELEGYTLNLKNPETQQPLPTYTPYPTFTPGAIVPTQEAGTPIPTTEPVNKCELRILDFNHSLRSDHSATSTIIVNISRLQWAKGIQFYYPLGNTEWANVYWQDNGDESAHVYTGWVQVTSNISYDPLGPCINLPSEHETPLPTLEPTATPAPTFTPVPTGVAPGDCQLFNPNDFGMRIRDKWNTTGQVVGSLAPGERALVGHIWPPVGSHETWAFIRTNTGLTGWTALRIGSTSFTDLEGDCSGIPDDDPFLAIPGAALMWHTVPGASRDTLLATYNVTKGKDTQFGAKPYASMDICIDSLENGGMCIYRPGNPDYPQDIGSSDPVQSALNFMQHAAWAAQVLSNPEYEGRVWIEPINEAYMGDDNHVEDYDWWNAWMITYIEEAARLGWPPLALPSLGPGHGTYTMFLHWKSSIELNYEHGGLFSMHAYAPQVHCGGDGSLSQCDPWCACRHRTTVSEMKAVGIQIARISLTEAASGFGNEPVSVVDFVTWFELVRYDEWLHSVCLWTMGHHERWPLAKLDDYAVEIASLITIARIPVIIAYEERSCSPLRQ